MVQQRAPFRGLLVNLNRKTRNVDRESFFSALIPSATTRPSAFERFGELQRQAFCRTTRLEKLRQTDLNNLKASCSQFGNEFSRCPVEKDMLTDVD